MAGLLRRLVGALLDSNAQAKVDETRQEQEAFVDAEGHAHNVQVEQHRVVEGPLNELQDAVLAGAGTPNQHAAIPAGATPMAAPGVPAPTSRPIIAGIRDFGTALLRDLPAILQRAIDARSQQSTSDVERALRDMSASLESFINRCDDIILPMAAKVAPTFDQLEYGVTELENILVRINYLLRRQSNADTSPQLAAMLMAARQHVPRQRKGRRRGLALRINGLAEHIKARLVRVKARIDAPGGNKKDEYDWACRDLADTVRSHWSQLTDLREAIRKGGFFG